jgi:hypothetical protein
MRLKSPSKYLTCAVFAVVLTGSATADALPASQLRCGWFVNPTPANVWLVDRDGEWSIGVQGGHQAEGDWPLFKPYRWVRTSGNYGYGCACLRVVADPATQVVVRIISSASRPLRQCRVDRALTEPNPE